MMGEHSGNQDRLFYSFNLDEHVPADHLLRGIDRFLDLADLRQHLAPFYSHTGRPSVDPELMVRMLLVGYCFGIRSERRLCEEVHLNLAYRWFCRLGLEDKVPDHSSFSKNRHGRFRESDVFRHVFEGVVRRCMAEGLVRGEGFAIDASVVKADANRQRGVPSTENIDWSNPALGTRAVHEYLQALEQDGQVGVAPMNISLTDPAARWTAAPGGPAFYAYSTNYLVDVHAGVILDVEATAAHRTGETDAARTMIDRVEQRFDLKPKRLIGDTAYGSAPVLGWLVEEKQIEPHIPVWDKTQRTDSTLSSSAFQWDEQRDEYRCPQGHALRRQWRPFTSPRTHVTKADTIIYRSSQSDCATCPIKSRCCPSTPTRKIARSVHESARDVARAIAKTRVYRQSRRDRKKVEMLFAHLKRILNLTRLRLRGMSGARDEFLLAAIAQNLRRMAKSWHPPPPHPAFAAT
ncbi:MAG TPA: IS1182 family transposase [Steroidobacteraceae bacterium]|nr:IS1182 family transposase [Steroidobacteraceae bacterium]